MRPGLQSFFPVPFEIKLAFQEAKQEPAVVDQRVELLRKVFRGEVVKGVMATDPFEDLQAGSGCSRSGEIQAEAELRAGGTTPPGGGLVTVEVNSTVQVEKFAIFSGRQ